MISLMEDDSGFRLAQSPGGYNIRTDCYSGTMMFSDGTVMNLVPEIKPSLSDEGSARTFIQMLYSIFGMHTTVAVDNVFEFFVRGFIDSVDKLIIRGLRSKYHLVSGNEKSFKGKIIFNEHIRQNYIHKERIYVEYETYSQNRPENRIIKAALEALARKTNDSRNAKDIKNLVARMEEIPTSTDVDKDFGMVVLDRNMVDYDEPLFWCRIFLKGMGLAGASKENVPYLLIIKTDSLFDAYVARMAASEHEEGMFRLKYEVNVKKDSESRGVSLISIDLGWTFYDRVNDRIIDDAERLYMTTPGYRVLPVGMDRIRTMAGSYLSDTLA